MMESMIFMPTNGKAIKSQKYVINVLSENNAVKFIGPQTRTKIIKIAQ